MWGLEALLVPLAIAGVRRIPSGCRDGVGLNHGDTWSWFRGCSHDFLEASPNSEARPKADAVPMSSKKRGKAFAKAKANSEGETGGGAAASMAKAAGKTFEKLQG